jgi:hypothetical protein
MTYTKKRVRQHIMEDRSIRIVRDNLPDEWVVREYRPDYGIDLSVELFEFVDEKKQVAATLGETLFVQVKSTDVVQSRRRRIHSRYNVELGPLREDPSKSVEIEVAPLQLETSELLTVQAMGSAIPVLLFLVELSTGRIYFLCLNDLIDKVVLPEDPEYHLKGSKVIYLPLTNCIVPGHPVSLLPLGTFAKRPKLYAAFEKFAYQLHQLEGALDYWTGAPSEAFQEEAAEKLMELVRHFLAIDLRYDFWTRIPEWEPIGWSHRELQALHDIARDPATDKDLEKIRDYLRTQPGAHRSEDRVRTMPLMEAQAEFYAEVRAIWRRLDNLSRMYEEIAREWFLPTYLSTLLCEDLRPQSG